MAEPPDTGALPDFDAWWDYAHPDSTEARFRELLPRARAAGDPDLLAQLLTQIARTEGLQRRFDDAHRTLDEAEGMLSADTPVARVRYLLERGRVFNSSGKAGEARPLFLRAWETAGAGGLDFYAVDAAHMMGIVETGDSSVAWNERAIALAETSTSERARGWLGSLTNNLGWTYHDAGEYTRALTLFERALAFRREHGTPEQVRIARWCVARAHRSLGRIREALAEQEALAAELEAAGAGDGYVEEELGECLTLLDRPSEAAPHFARAYALLSRDPWFREGEPERLARMKELGGVP